MRLKELVKKIRSKNAGPFLLTIDMSKLYKIPKKQIEIFPIEDLFIVKITIPRPNIQGSSKDRDLHGASFGIILEELKIK